MVPVSVPAPPPATAPHPASDLLVLTTALAKGHDDAWREFHGTHGRELFRRLLFATRGDRDLAAEALQHTYLRIARHARPCDSAPMFSSWLRRVASSALNDCRRRRRSFWSLLLRRSADPSDLPPLEAADSAVFSALDAALRELSGPERALLEAKYFDGQDVSSLAQNLQISAKAVESRLTRARAQLRHHLLSLLARHDETPKT